MKLLTTQDNKYLLWVSEETADRERVWVYYQHPKHKKGMVTKIVQFNYSDYKPYEVQHIEGWGVMGGYKKLLAYLPLTPDAAPLEGVPLLPPLSVQGYPEQEPMDYYPPKDLANAIWGNCFDYKDVDTKFKGETIKSRVRGACFAAERYFYFQAASQDRKYSEKQCLDAVTKVLSCWGTACINTKGTPNVEFLAEIEMTLRSLSPAAPLPVAFEPELVEVVTPNIPGNTEKALGSFGQDKLVITHKEPETITLPNGQQQLVGRYQYKED